MKLSKIATNNLIQKYLFELTKDICQRDSSQCKIEKLPNDKIKCLTCGSVKSVK